MASSPQLQSRLFALPRELRDEVYYHYLYRSDGYHHNPDTNRLIGANLALMFTCKAAAAEMNGLAIRFNPVTFSTIQFHPSFPHQDRVIRFQELYQAAQRTKLYFVALGAAFITPYIAKETRKVYPGDTICQAVQAIATNVIDVEGFCQHWQRYYPALDHVVQVLSETVVDALDLASQAHTLQLEIEAHRPVDGPVFLWGSHEEILAWQPNPWHIASEDELLRMESFIDTTGQRIPLYDTLPRWMFRESGESPFTPWYDQPIPKYHFSAAAAAIGFLESLPRSTRTQIRNIIVNENHHSVCESWQHSAGLIPLCLETP